MFNKFRIYFICFCRSTLTSMMMSVAGTPIKPNNPTEHTTEASTINTPPNPSVTLLSICNRGTFNLNTVKLRLYLEVFCPVKYIKNIIVISL